MTCIPSKCCPRGWVAERTLVWITRHRRTVRGYERLPAHYETYVYRAMIMTRPLARQPAAAVPSQSSWHTLADLRCVSAAETEGRALAQ